MVDAEDAAPLHKPTLNGQREITESLLEWRRH
jgi:hypothetical protein